MQYQDYERFNTSWFESWIGTGSEERRKMKSSTERQHFDPTTLLTSYKVNAVVKYEIWLARPTNLVILNHAKFNNIINYRQYPGHRQSGQRTLPDSTFQPNIFRRYHLRQGRRNSKCPTHFRQPPACTSTTQARNTCNMSETICTIPIIGDS